jgi:hypothetical protein
MNLAAEQPMAARFSLDHSRAHLGVGGAARTMVALDVVGDGLVGITLDLRPATFRKPDSGVVGSLVPRGGRRRWRWPGGGSRPPSPPMSIPAVPPVAPPTAPPTAPATKAMAPDAPSTCDCLAS